VKRFTAAVLLLAVGSAALARPPTPPARVGEDRPLTTRWRCENDAEVLVNAHPRRRIDEAWVTYAGQRTATRRCKTGSGVRFESADRKLSWWEKGDEATLEIAELLDRPLLCRRQAPPPKTRR
jgi:membrane-bound inhibitor of C-type lysozyme